MNLKDKISKLNKEESIETLFDVIIQQKKVIAELKQKSNNQKKELHRKNLKNRYITSDKPSNKLKRYLEILTVKSSSSKITFNPVTGRITLKVSDKSSDTVRKKFIQVAEIIKESDYSFAPYTYRGTIRYVIKSYIYRVTMSTGSKKFKAIIFETK